MKKKEKKKKRIWVALVFVILFFIARPYLLSARLIEEIQKGDVNAVQKFLDYNHFDVNTPLFKNTYFTLLMEIPAETPLSAACWGGNYEIVKLLIDHGATAQYVPGTGWPPILRAALRYQPDDYKIIKLLLEHGADVNALDGRDTPVSCAAEMIPRKELPESLRKPDSSAYEDRYDESIARDIRDIVDLLIENGADVTGHSLGLNYSLLYQASSWSNLLVVEYLVEERGLDVNQRDFSGRTALFGPEEKYSNVAPMCTQQLLAYGADKTMKDDEGKTAYDYAVERGDAKIAELLKP